MHLIYTCIAAVARLCPSFRSYPSFSLLHWLFTLTRNLLSFRQMIQNYYNNSYPFASPRALWKSRRLSSSSMLRVSGTSRYKLCYIPVRLKSSYIEDRAEAKPTENALKMRNFAIYIMTLIHLSRQIGQKLAEPWAKPDKFPKFGKFLSRRNRSILENSGSGIYRYSPGSSINGGSI